MGVSGKSYLTRVSACFLRSARAHPWSRLAHSGLIFCFLYSGFSRFFLLLVRFIGFVVFLHFSFFVPVFLFFKKLDIEKV
jgi:hypothetical protein